MKPIYKNIYVKANISGEFIITNHYLIADLKKEGLWNEEMLELIKGQEGDLSGISAIPEHIRVNTRKFLTLILSGLLKLRLTEESGLTRANH